MTSDVFVEWAKEHGVHLLFIQPCNPNQNAFIDRFNKSFQFEVLNINLFNTVHELQAAAVDWLMDYNEYRSHKSLDDCHRSNICPGCL
jgi:putative transposase